MTILNQRDPRWANLQLGTSSVTIGSHGCLITSIASILNTTPDVVNERLKSVNGFKDGNLVIWAKIPEAFPGVSCQRVWSYNNDDVLQNIPCIVQVDGSPIGAPMHFVAFVGDHKLMDPWTGTIDPTSKYTPLSYALIKGAWAQTTQDNQISVLLESQIQATSACQTQLKECLDQNARLQIQNDSLQTELNKVKLELENETHRVLSLKDEIATIHKEDKDYGQEALDAQHIAKDRGDLLHMIGNEVGVQYNTTNDKQLVEEILQKVSELQRLQQVQDIPEVQQLNAIVKFLISMGANTYLSARGSGQLVTDKLDPDLTHKVGVYLNDLANELTAANDIIQSNQFPSSTSSSSPTQSIMQKSLKPKRSFKSLFRPIINLFFVSQ